MSDLKRLDGMIRNVHTSLGGRATDEQVAFAVVQSIPLDERERFLIEHVKTRVSRALRAKTDTGLAFAQAINGTYVQLPLMDEAEYRFVARQHLKLSGDHYRIAVRYVAHCREHLGVDISDELFRRSA